MNCSDEKIKRTPCQLLRHFRLRASDTGMAKDNQLFGFFYFLLTFACSPQWRRQGLGKLVIVFLCSFSSLRLGKAVLKNLLLGIIAAEFTVARDIMKQALGGRTLRASLRQRLPSISLQDFRLRMAIARAKLEKAREGRKPCW